MKDCFIFSENPTGIPSFWLTILKNIDLTSEMVQVICYC